jgi:hypothetical protein
MSPFCDIRAAIHVWAPDSHTSERSSAERVGARIDARNTFAIFENEAKMVLDLIARSHPIGHFHGLRSVS